MEYTVLLTRFGVVNKLDSTHILDFSLKEHTEMNSHLGKSKYEPLKRGSNQNIFILFFAFWIEWVSVRFLFLWPI